MNHPSPSGASAGASPARPGGQAALYLLRALGAWMLLGGLFLNALAARYSLDNKAALFELVTQLDLFRALFYATLPAAALLLLAPACPTPVRRVTALLLLSAATAVLCGWLVGAAIDQVRPRPHPHNYAGLAGAYLALNVCCLLWLHCGGRLGPRLQRLALWGVGLFDLLIPALVWAAYRRQSGRMLIALRPLPMLLVCAAQFVPWTLGPQQFPDLDAPSPALRRLTNQPGNLYQVVVLADGTLLLADNSQRLSRVDPRSGALLGRLDAGLPGIQSVALDADGRAVFCEPAAGRTLLIDPAGPALLERRPIENPLDAGAMGNIWRTLRRPQGDRLAAMCMEWLALLDGAGTRVLAWREDYFADAAFDPRRAQLHATRFDPGALLCFDLQELRLVRSLDLPRFVERIALDQRDDKLLLTLPLAGQVWAVDLETYQPVLRAISFPGVRTLAVDEQRRLLYLAGFAPLIEVRDLDDLSLLDRVAAPPWVRWIALDPDGAAAYLTSGRYGLYRLDLAACGPDAPGSRWRRLDPFYPLLGLASRALQSLLGWG